MIVVSNSSPLIVLARLNRFDLLQSLFAQICIPEEVHQEVVVQGAGMPGAAQAGRADWIHVRKISDCVKHMRLRSEYHLGSGEAAVIILAKELPADLALLDERKARLLATAQGVDVMGTVAVLEMGYRNRFVQDLRVVYRDLEHAGVRVDREILNHSLSSFNLEPL